MCEKPSAAKRICQALNSTRSLDTKESKKDNRLKNGSYNLLKSGSSFLSALDRKGHNYIICHALGHLYVLADSKVKGKAFPIFDPVWVPLSHQSNKSTSAKFLKYKIEKILKEISDLSKNATGFIHACDYDQEGEVIGYNILQFACGKKYDGSKRAKFSTLTDEEITKSFENLLPPNLSLKDAGITRHTIDFIYGINFSRILTNFIKKYSDQSIGKRFVQLSIGRVQGPTLAFVVERENEIIKHIPIPYWNVIADFVRGGVVVEKEKLKIASTGRASVSGLNISDFIRTIYFPQKIESKDTAIRVVEECRDQFGTVTFAKTFKTPIKPPYPFNLGDLQREAFRIFRFTPSYTLSLAEKLYLAALISYPRTSSQKLPPTINYKNIINNISSFDKPASQSQGDKNIYNAQRKLSLKEICHKLLTKPQTTSLSPNEGKENDPAHPAIYPTGERPKKALEQSESKLFDLIIRRFLSTFGTDAEVSQTTLNITVKEKYIFKSDEKKILSKGWIEFYDPYFDYSTFATNSSNLSILKINDKLRNIEIEILEKSTQPPPRYNQSTLLQKMEKEKIGTKATRSEIINTLFKRNYVYNFSSLDREDDNVDLQQQQQQGSKNSVKLESKSDSDSKGNNTIAYRRTGIRPTQLGISLINSMQKYVPSIVSTGLTRTMEEHLTSIESGENSSDFVIRQAQTMVKKGIESFVKNQTDIGKEISASLKNDSQALGFESKKTRITVIGRCPVCRNGNLIIKSSAKTKKRFAGCSNYLSQKCTVTAALPRKGIIRGTEKVCDRCKWPIILATGINEGKKYQWRLCLNSECPLKKEKVKRQ
ncbi:MAG TPA: DNA topoisomerase [Candidatus Nitrosocosmicus sp.]|nr:DNA topoisomerase [Candidatus Nitrosocosmicus sp.]